MINSCILSINFHITHISLSRLFWTESRPSLRWTHRHIPTQIRSSARSCPWRSRWRDPAFYNVEDAHPGGSCRAVVGQASNRTWVIRGTDLRGFSSRLHQNRKKIFGCRIPSRPRKKDEKSACRIQLEAYIMLHSFNSSFAMSVCVYHSKYPIRPLSDHQFDLFYIPESVILPVDPFIHSWFILQKSCSGI